MDFSQMLESKAVLSSEQSFGRFCVGFLELNNEASLNALTIDMLETMQDILMEWMDRDDMVAVVLHSKSDKAFCAGGDVKSVAEAIRRTHNLEYAKMYFEQEYRVDALLRHYPKPVLCWADGYVMGGGLGLAQAADFVLVTEHTQMAMPETQIGFFPDVGASLFLNQVPHNIGWYMALTASRVSGREAMSLNLCQALVERSQKRYVFADILRLPWSSDPAQNRLMLGEYIKKRSMDQKLAPSWMLAEQEAMNELFALDFSSVLEWFKVNARNRASSPRGQSAQMALEGSLRSMQIVLQQRRRLKGISSPDVYDWEYDLALRMADQPDFVEGVRAKLIDKDQTAKWQQELLSDGELNVMFTPPSQATISNWLKEIITF